MPITCQPLNYYYTSTASGDSFMSVMGKCSKWHVSSRPQQWHVYKTLHTLDRSGERKEEYFSLSSLRLLKCGNHSHIATQKPQWRTDHQGMSIQRVQKRATTHYARCRRLHPPRLTLLLVCLSSCAIGVASAKPWFDLANFFRSPSPQHLVSRPTHSDPAKRSAGSHLTSER